MSNIKLPPYGETHEALVGLWGLYWKARCPDLVFGVNPVPRDNLVSLKIKEDIIRVTRALTAAHKKIDELTHKE